MAGFLGEEQGTGSGFKTVREAVQPSGFKNCFKFLNTCLKCIYKFLKTCKKIHV